MKNPFNAIRADYLLKITYEPMELIPSVPYVYVWCGNDIVGAGPDTPNVRKKAIELKNRIKADIINREYDFDNPPFTII